MQIGVAGLGRMGANISRRPMMAVHSMVIRDANRTAIASPSKDGTGMATGVKGLFGKVSASLMTILP